MSHEVAPQYVIKVGEGVEKLHWAKRKFEDIDIMPEARNQGPSPTCQFSAIAAGCDMGYKRSKAEVGSAEGGSASNIKFQEKDFITEAKSRLKIEKLIVGHLPSTEYLLEMAETNGIFATSSEWTEKTKLKIQGYSSGKPKSTQVKELLGSAVPLLASFDCEPSLSYLKPNQVYKSPSRIASKKKEGVCVTGHLVLVCGYGLTKNLLLYLIFLNSWSEKFCEDGYGRILFASIKDFYTLEIFWRPQPPIPTVGEKTVVVTCSGFNRKVEKNIIELSKFMSSKLQMQINSEGKQTQPVVLPVEVTPLVFSLILGYLRFLISTSEQKDLISFGETFVNNLPTKTLFGMMRGAETLDLQPLAAYSARVLLERTNDWTDVEVFKHFSGMEKEGLKELTTRKSAIVRLAERFQGW